MVIDSGNNFPANNNAGKARQSSTTHVSDKKPAEQNTANEVSAKSESVSLSDAGKSLVQLEAKVASSPDVDIAKVDAIKTAIANDSYNIDDAAIASALLSQENLL